MFGVVKNRLYKYLLKRLFGRYLDEDLDSVQVSVEGESVTVRNLHLRSGSYRSYLDSASAEQVTVQVPWRNLLQEGCQVTISGLSVEVNIEGGSAVDDCDIDSNPPSPADDAYLHRALLRLFNRDYSSENLDSSGVDDEPIGSNTRSLDCVTDYIRQVFARTRIVAVNVRVDLRTAKTTHVVACIPSLQFQNGLLELGDGAELYHGRSHAPFLAVADPFRVSFNDQTISCDIDSIHGTIPIALLSGQQSLGSALPDEEIRSEASDPEAKQIIAGIDQFKLNVREAALVFESEEARFAFNLKDWHIDIGVAPKFALRSCTVGMVSLTDQISSIPVLWFAQAQEPVFALSSDRLVLKRIQISVNVFTLYRLKAMLKECLTQIPSRQAVIADRLGRECDFTVSLRGPTVLQYTGYLELTIDSEIIVSLGLTSGCLTIESSSVRLREIQQDPILLLSSKVTVRTRFSYATGSLPSLPSVPPSTKRTSRIFQLSDFDSTEPDSLLLPTRIRREYLAAATIGSTCEADHVELYLNEHVLIGLYSAFKNHSQKPVASAVDLSKLLFSWAYNLSVREMTILYKTHTSTFSLHAPSGISIFASSLLLNISLNSISLKRDSADMLSHISHLEDPASSTALELSMLWRKDRLDHAVTIRNVVLNVNHDVFDLVDCGMSLYRMSKKISAGYHPVNRNCSIGRSFSFHINFEDCAILLSPGGSSGSRLTLAFEKFSNAISNARVDAVLCGLSLHLLDELPAANLPTYIRSSLIEYLIDSGEVVIMSLDMAEGKFHLNAVSLDVGHITIMTSAETFTSAYRAGLSFFDQISPLLFAIASSVRHYDSSFSVSEQHDDAVLSSTQEILLPKIASWGLPIVDVPASMQDDDDSELDDCLMFDDTGTYRSDTEHSVASFVQESYCSVASASLPNQNEMKAQFLNCDFSIVETHFTSSNTQKPNQPYAVDQKVLDSEMNDPVLQLSLNLSIGRIVLRLFGGRGFKYWKSHRPYLDHDQVADQNKRYLVDLSEFIEEEFMSLRQSFSSANGDRRLYRAPGDLIEIVLSGLQFSQRSYASSTGLSDSHNFDGTLASIVIHDHVRESHFARVLGPLTKLKRCRNHCTKALAVSIESVNAASYCAEHRVEVQLGPLDLTLDGATLAFAMDFATGIESVLEPVVATPLEGERDTVQVLVNLDPTVYVHFFECEATALNVTYRPAHADFGSIQSPADCLKLLQLLPVQNAMFELKQVSLRGLSGYTRAICEIIQIWARDIARNQYHKYLTSIVPFGPVVRFGGSIKDLIQRYRTHLTQLYNMFD